MRIAGVVSISLGSDCHRGNTTVMQRVYSNHPSREGPGRISLVASLDDRSGLFVPNLPDHPGRTRRG